MRVLHLSHDNQFVARASEYFEEVAPGANRYVIFAPAGAVEHQLAGATEVAATVADAQRMVVQGATSFDALIVHFMFPAWAKVVPEIAQHIPVVWSGFGGDYYGSADDGKSVSLGPLTRAIAGTNHSHLSIPGRLHRWWRSRPNEAWLSAAASSVSYFSAPVPNDIDVFNQRFPGFTGRYAQLNYAAIPDRADVQRSHLGPNLLLGNSATPTNNHLEMFKRLEGLDLQGRKVVVPLSYGDTGAYRSVVLAAGQRAFGSDFEPLLEMLPPAEYDAVISECEFVMMGHLRQQGLGNIIAALRTGATVVLEGSNPVYAALRTYGIALQEFGDLRAGSLGDYALSGEEQRVNAEVSARVWGRTAVLNRVRGLLDLIEARQ